MPVPVADLEVDQERAAADRGKVASYGSGAVSSLFVRYADGVRLFELYRLDFGVESQRLAELPGPIDKSLGAFDGWAYFTVGFGSLMHQIWRSNGQEAEPVSGDIRFEVNGTGRLPDGTLLFGTESGLIRFVPGQGLEVVTEVPRSPSAFTQLSDGRVVFGSIDDDWNYFLWVSDGTTVGTKTVPIPGVRPYWADLVALSDGNFLAWGEGAGETYELWRLDPEGAPEVLLTRSETGSAQFIDDGERVWFTLTATSGVGPGETVRTEVWSTDGQAVQRELGPAAGLRVLDAVGSKQVVTEDGILRVYASGTEVATRDWTAVASSRILEAHIVDDVVLSTVRAGDRYVVEVLKGERSATGLFEARPELTDLGRYWLATSRRSFALIDIEGGWLEELYRGPETVFSEGSAPRFFPAQDGWAPFQAKGVLWATDGENLRQIAKAEAEAGVWLGPRFYWAQKGLGVELWGWDPRTNEVRLLRAAGGPSLPTGERPVLKRLPNGLALSFAGRVLVSDGTRSGTWSPFSQTSTTIRETILVGASGAYGGLIFGSGSPSRLLAVDGSTLARSVTIPGDWFQVQGEATPEGWVLWAANGQREYVFSRLGYADSATARLEVGPSFRAGGPALGLTPSGAVFPMTDDTGARLVVVNGQGVDSVPLPQAWRGFSSVAMADGRVVFIHGPSDGLWVTDGTEDGTRPLGVALNEPTTLRPLNGLALFARSEPETGLELWLSDGTPEGTGPLMDFAPGKAPGGLAFYRGEGSVSAVADLALLPLYTKDSGVEPWRIPMHQLPCALACCSSSDCGGRPCVNGGCATEPSMASGGDDLNEAEGCGCSASRRSAGSCRELLLGALLMLVASRLRTGPRSGRAPA